MDLSSLDQAKYTIEYKEALLATYEQIVDLASLSKHLLDPNNLNPDNFMHMVEDVMAYLKIQLHICCGIGGDVLYSMLDGIITNGIKDFPDIFRGFTADKFHQQIDEKLQSYDNVTDWQQALKIFTQEFFPDGKNSLSHTVAIASADLTNYVLYNIEAGIPVNDDSGALFLY